MRTVIGPTERVEYVTKNAHVGYPAGTKCVASRSDPRLLRLEFPDGQVLESPDFYLEGIETR